MITLAQAAPPQPATELQNTFFLLILGVAAMALFLWLIMSHFSRPP
ncbi:MAG: hypothetical protein QN152_11455 [Armatimonadota bacterium]|nr:hypothetical protein [Armatimonadota bacterium]MDR7427963.1 hypothetical protein [Armatimonadota bacterium]MDR7464146.1 hypothetical protein [Armatimonadota bacterium]MDR7470437.1 hypothetical protein [Armatimonadota bacterium]MDR7473519.1 hypothetical protein [Armatimonadota bacterium]